MFLRNAREPRPSGLQANPIQSSMSRRSAGEIAGTASDVHYRAANGENSSRIRVDVRHSCPVTAISLLNAKLYRFTRKGTHQIMTSGGTSCPCRQCATLFRPPLARQLLRFGDFFGRHVARHQIATLDGCILHGFAGIAKIRRREARGGKIEPQVRADIVLQNSRSIRRAGSLKLRPTCLRHRRCSSPRPQCRNRARRTPSLRRIAAPGMTRPRVGRPPSARAKAIASFSRSCIRSLTATKLPDRATWLVMSLAGAIRPR